MKFISFLVIVAGVSIFHPVLAEFNPQLEWNIGDVAPSLGPVRVLKEESVRTVDVNKIYVVEFWGIGCVPCIQGIPHLTALARQYRGQVSFISIHIYQKDIESVVRFVDGMGSQMDYTVVMEDAASTASNHWRRPAGVSWIPIAYIVKDAKVLWIGHPDSLDTPLAQVISGTYDLQAAIQHRNQRHADIDELHRLEKYPPLVAALKGFDYSSQMRIYEQAFAMNPRLEMYVDYGLFPALRRFDKEHAFTYAHELLEKLTLHQMWSPINRSNWLDDITRSLLEPSDAADRDPELALRFAKEAFEMAPTKGPSNYALLANAYFAVGDYTRAIELQKHAVLLARQIPEYYFFDLRDRTIKNAEALLAQYRAHK